MNFSPRRRYLATAALGAAISLGVGIGAGTGTAAARGAHAVSLTTHNINCDASPTSGSGIGSGTGFVVFNENSRDTVIAVVVLRGAQPNTTYTVRLIEAPSGSDCQIVDGTITTNVVGNGTVNVREPLTGPSVFVAVNNTTNPANDYYTTQVVTP
jgi:hypothetical protein